MKLLEVHGARYLLIGGYAVSAFGHVRNTLDIDVWIASGNENQRSVVSAVREFGFVHAEDSILDEPDAMLRMGVPPLRIEVVKRISGVDFDSCWERRVWVEDGDLRIPVISLPDLKANKRAAGRTKDLLDLESLP